MTFFHILSHSSYSLLEALPSVEGLVEAAAQAGMPALGLADHHLLTGAVEFTLACQREGIQPILGLELDVRVGEKAQVRLTLFAEDERGWSSLCQLSSQSQLQTVPGSPLSLDVLAERPGLVALLPAASATAPLVGELKGYFPRSLYLGISGAHAAGAELAVRLGLPLVAAPPVYALKAEHTPLLRTLTAIRKVCPVAAVPAGELPPSGALFLSAAEGQARFSAYPRALAGLEELRQRCRGLPPIGRQHYPQLELPEGQTALEALRQRAEAGAKRLYGTITPQIQARLAHELAVIGERGYEPIFLIVQEILAYARQQGVPVSSRGSAASSLVAHCLEITSPDPLALDLYFERFLNPARATPPDIDTDICSRRRDSILAHVFTQYGAERAAVVATINRFRPRSALGDVAKAHGITPAQVREMTASLPHAFFSRREEEQSPQASPFDALRKAYSQPAAQAVFDQAQALLGLPRHLSMHPGGMVIAPQRMDTIMPLCASGGKGITITQMDLESVEALGLIKIDLLGIRGLTVLGDVAEAVRAWRLTEFPGPLDVLERIPAQDAEVSDRVEHGQTIGCFQIESPGMRATLKDIRARTPEDIMAALALYRPGPLGGGLRDAFVRRFKGEEVVSHLHPSLAPVLERTYGVILYQEQVLRIAHQIAGLSLAEADLLRRAMSHFDPGKQMALLKEKFIRGAGEKSAMPPETGEQIWEMMAAFAGYGFPQAHAASYAQVAWRSAWCKTHYPAEFFAAVLANWGGYYSQRVYLNEARRMKMDVRPPDVNHSKSEFSVAYLDSGPVLFMGLDQVKDLSQRTISAIRRGRPYTSLADFLARVDPRPKEAENLAVCGALNRFGSEAQVLASLRGGRWKAGQMSLFGWQAEAPPEEWSLEQRAAAQQEVLGASLAAHPLDLVRGQLAGRTLCTSLEAAGKIGQRVSVAGVRQTSHRARTARGETILFMTLEDLEGALDVIVFPDLYRRVRQFVFEPLPMVISGMVERDPERGEPLLRAERVERVG